MPQPLKQLFIDIETTGMDPKQHGIHQIAGSIRIDGTEVERFDYKMQHAPQLDIEKASLDYCGISIDTLRSYKPYYQVRPLFLEMLNRHKHILRTKDKYHVVGYNSAGFDVPFLRPWMDAYGLKDIYGEYCYNASIDVMALAAEHLKKVRYRMPGFKLEQVAEWLGISLPGYKAHDAAWDARLMEAVYDFLTKEWGKV